MKTFIFAVSCLVGYSGIALADESQDRPAALSDVRSALALRDFDTAKTALAAAKKLTGEAKFDEELARVERLHDLLLEFWKAVDAGGKSLQATEELVINGQRAAVVEYENYRLVIRVAGQNRQHTLRDLPNNLTNLLAERSIKSSAAQNKPFYGAYHAMDARGDRAEARRLWNEAQKANIDVADLLPELSVPNKFQAAADLPKLTPIAREILLPKHWTVRKLKDEMPKRGPLDKYGTVNADGRLVISIPAAETGPVQILFERGIQANVTARIMLLDVPSGASFGLFSATAAEHSQTAFLPEGTSTVEFTRIGKMLTATADKEKLNVNAAADTPERFGGYIGLELPPGSSCTIALFEMAGR